MNKIFAILLAVLLVAGCTSQQQQPPQQSTNQNQQQAAQQSTYQQSSTESQQSSQSQPPQPTTTTQPPQPSNQLAKNYFRYSLAAYEKARSEGKIIFLDFYAAWCPICNSENPNILDAFNEMTAGDVIGFQVHYNDDKTNAEDVQAARSFGIGYQHTKVVINKNGNIVSKSLDFFTKVRVLTEIEKARNS